jgi:hypothetical protein
VDPVPDPILLRKSGNPGNRTRTSGSVARNSDLKTTEAVGIDIALLNNGSCLVFASRINAVYPL